MVLAPLFLSVAEIEAFLRRHEKFLTKLVAETRAAAAARERHLLGYGSVVPVLGQERLICAAPPEDACLPVALTAGELRLSPNLDAEQLKRQLQKFYRALAKKELAERVFVFAAKMGVSPCAVKINGAKMRWGSCSSAGNLNFSWRAAMASPAALDYLAVHELAHLLHLDHSPSFWQVVERFFPEHPAAKKELAALQKRLKAENWDE